MSFATPREVLTAMIGMFASGNVDSAPDVVSEAYRDHRGLDGPLEGVAGFVRVVAAARRNYRLLDVCAEDLLQDGDRAAARIRWRGERPDGSVEERETIDIVRVEGGRAVEHWGATSWRRSRPT